MREPSRAFALTTGLACSLGLAVARPAQASNVRLTIVSAKLDAKRLPKSSHPAPDTHLSDLACWSLPGLRAVPGLCASLVSAGEAKGAAVDALVRVEIGEHVIRTYPIPGQLQPAWQYSAVLDSAFLTGSEWASFQLLDYDGPGAEQKLGDKLVKARELAKPGTRTITGVGGHSITIRVEAIPDSTPARTYSFRVPGDRQMADLARTAPTSGSGYVLVPVAEGEELEISAKGQVQPSAKKHPNIVAGPNGIPTIQTKIQFNQPGFRGCPECNHAALLGQIGLQGFIVGAHKQLTVEHAGLLVLGINDLKVEDNAGGFDVTVTVRVPATTSTARTPPRKKGSAADAGPPAMDARTVQQLVDAHGPELDACAEAASNPYGELVLSFTIAGDGRMLGVIVEKASPNLKQAGECMRKKALTWRFPPPHDVVTARYPISYSAS